MKRSISSIFNEIQNDPSLQQKAEKLFLSLTQDPNSEQINDHIKNLKEGVLTSNAPLSSIIKGANNVAGNPIKTAQINELVTNAEEFIGQYAGNEVIEKIKTIDEDKITEIWDKNLLREVVRFSLIYITDMIHYGFNHLDDDVKMKKFKNDYFSDKSGPFKLLSHLFLDLGRKVLKDVVFLAILDVYFIVTSTLIASLSILIAPFAATHALINGKNPKQSITSAIKISSAILRYVSQGIIYSQLDSIADPDEKDIKSIAKVNFLKDVYKRRLKVWKRPISSMIVMLKNPGASMKLMSNQFKNLKKFIGKSDYYEPNDTLNGILTSNAVYINEKDDKVVKVPKDMKKFGWKTYGEMNIPKNKQDIPYTVSQTFINHQQKKIIISFKGTSNKQDLKTDSFISKNTLKDELLPVLLNHLQVPENFSEIINKHANDVIKFLDENDEQQPIAMKKSIEYTNKILRQLSADGNINNLSDYEIMFTGHSLGGVLAQQSLAKCCQQDLLKFKTVKCHVFESPGVTEQSCPNLKNRELHNYMIKETLVSQVNINNSLGITHQLDPKYKSNDLKIYDLVIKKSLKKIASKIPVKISEDKKELMLKQAELLLSIGYHKTGYLEHAIRETLRDQQEPINAPEFTRDAVNPQRNLEHKRQS